jgi:hypothetical protein
MNAADFFQVLPEFAVFRPTGSSYLEEGIEAITAAILLARERKQPKLLIDVSIVVGLESPSVTARYWMLRKWADASEDKVILAVIAPPEMIDWQKFGVTSGQNAGLICEVFTSEAGAVAWLRNFNR